MIEVETRARLSELVERLPRDQRSVLVMRFGQEMSTKEVAAEMQRSEGAVKLLQHRALQTLRGWIGDDNAYSAKHEALDRAIDHIVFGGDVASTGDEDLDALNRVASGLRGMADPRFKARLREELAGEPDRSASRLNVPIASWFRGQRAFLAAGSSSGLVAGTCCVSGATVHILGLSSAAAVTDFIHSTLPYFIALSVAGLLGWLWWILREQGITPATIVGTAKHHGLALRSGYAAVFAATMSLSMVMGLY